MQQLVVICFSDAIYLSQYEALQRRQGIVGHDRVERCLPLGFKRFVILLVPLDTGQRMLNTANRKFNARTSADNAAIPKIKFN